MIPKTVRKVLRSPTDLKILESVNDSFFRTDDGKTYPLIEGILCLLDEHERHFDLGDDLFYDQNPFGERDWSSEADVEAGVENELKNLLRRFNKSALMIDVGCGTGRISNYLSLKGYKNIVSLDFSLVSLKQVNNNNVNTCIWGNNLHLPLKSNSFELVISSGVIHHTPDPHKAFEECVRILKPGGIIYLRTYNVHSLYCFFYYTYGLLLRLFESSRWTRFLSDWLGLRVYIVARKLLFSLPDRDDRILKAKFNNLFTKRMVYFFKSSELRRLIEKHNLHLESYRVLGKTHRMHCYVAQKSL